MEKITEQEKALLDADISEYPGQEVNEVIVDENWDDEPYVAEKDGQLVLPAEPFQRDTRIAGMTHDIEEGYKSLFARVKAVSEHGTFFRKLGEYVASLDVDTETEAVRSNLLVGLVHCAALEKDLSHAVEQLEKVQEVKKQLNQVAEEGEDNV